MRVENKALIVPSLECASLVTSSVENGTRSVSSDRTAAGRLVIASYDAVPRAVHSHTCLARKGGWPRSVRVLSRSWRSMGRALQASLAPPMRLAKYLAHAGVASRRAAEAIIADGRVTVDGAIVTDPARDTDDTHLVTVDGARDRHRQRRQERAVWLVHKPRGVVSTAKDTHNRPTVVDMVDAPGARLYPVGRLDADTTGLILLTDDGDLANRLTHPRYEVPKVYVAEVGRGGTASGGRAAPAARRRDPRRRQDRAGRRAPAQARRPGDHAARGPQAPGQADVRRGRPPVARLKRVAFGPLRLGDLAEGRVRRLSPAEVQRLRDAAAPPARAPG